MSGGQLDKSKLETFNLAMINFFANFDGTNMAQEEEAAHHLTQLDCMNLAKAGDLSSKKTQKMCQNQLNLSNLIREVFETHR